jgi:uncharacterized repeat protein (TIGR01451 family)
MSNLLNQSHDGAHASQRFAFLSKGRALRKLNQFIFLLAVGLFSFGAIAADADPVALSVKKQSPIVIQLQQFKVAKDAKGEIKFDEATAVLPGEVIEYRATYSNQGTTALPVVATLPIPEGLEYVKDSAKANNKIAHTVAQKDAQFSNEPLVQKVSTASGATLSQPIPYSSYRYVRWDLGRLSPGNSIEVSVRAKVAQNLEVDVSAEDKTRVLASSSPKK